MPSESHETSIVDHYYSWGWTVSGAGKVKPMPAPKLCGRKMIGADNRKSGVLFVSTSFPRYLIQFPSLPSDFSEYLEWQQRFLLNLTADLRALMRVRFHYADFGWEISARITGKFPEIQKEDWAISFAESMENCRLYVCDHLSTTFVEALAADKPTIIFWNPISNMLRPEAIPYYEKLVHAGILFDSPEAAASALPAAYEDVEKWWGDESRKAARREFCSYFGRTSRYAIGEWATELRNIAESSTRLEDFVASE
jgi:putative transferase (TIGR04331 family)